MLRKIRGIRCTQILLRLNKEEKPIKSSDTVTRQTQLWRVIFFTAKAFSVNKK